MYKNFKQAIKVLQNESQIDGEGTSNVTFNWYSILKLI